MDINIKIKPALQIRALYLFFIIVGVQVGVGILGAPQFIFKEARQDSWISILMAFVFMVIVVFAMLATLKQYKNADIFGIQVDLFGKWIGKLFGTIYILYFTASFISIMLTYSQVINIFLYQSFPNIVLGFVLLLITIYAVLGGFRTVVGISFLFFFLGFWLLFVYYDPITRIDWTNYMPMFTTSMPELLKGSRNTVYTLLGFEILFVVYPYIQNKEKIKLPVFLALTYTTFILLISTMIAIGYFSYKGLEFTDWAVIGLLKNVSFALFERLDYIIIVTWVLVIIPNLTLLMWSITYGLKRLYNFKQKTSLFTLSTIFLIVVVFVNYDYHASNFTDFVSNVGFCLVFIYPLVLFPIVVVKKKWQQKKKGSGSP